MIRLSRAIVLLAGFIGGASLTLLGVYVGWLRPLQLKLEDSFHTDTFLRLQIARAYRTGNLDELGAKIERTLPRDVEMTYREFGNNPSTRYWVAQTQLHFVQYNLSKSPASEALFGIPVGETSEDDAFHSRTGKYLFFQGMK